MHMHYYKLHKRILSVPQDEQETWQFLESEAHNGGIHVTLSLSALSSLKQIIRNALKDEVNRTDSGVNLE